MGYLALARKWRPKSFQEVVGQDHVVKALSNALDSGRVHHAYLFTGTRGVGKTTLARIFAKSLNCEEGTSAEPCQRCSTCHSIDDGRFVDLIEVDAASRTKVDDTRELLENVQYAPTSGQYKVYLIDEVHMLSGHSFNALLKTLEEPPAHVKFLFATTDPQKMPVTVLSRCLQFNLRAMRPEQVENQLVKILEQEKIDYEISALQALAKAADGSMRDGLSLLDQAIAQSSASVSLSEVAAMLGTIKSEHSAALMNALVTQDAVGMMQVVADMADHAVDFSTALDELLVQLYNISLAQVAPAALTLKQLDIADLTAHAKALSPEIIQLYYQIGLHSKKDIVFAPSLRIGFEMALLRMLLFEPSAGPVETRSTPVSSDSSPVKQPTVQAEQHSTPVGPLDAAVTASPPLAEVVSLDSVERRSPGESSASAEPCLNVEPYLNDEKTSLPQQFSHPSKVDVSQQLGGQEQGEPAYQNASSANSSEGLSKEQVTEPPHPSASGILANHNEWGALIEQSQLVGLTREFAMHCACERLLENRAELCLSPKLEHLNKPERIATIEQELQRQSGRAFSVDLKVEDSDFETPAQCLERLNSEQLAQIKSEIEQQSGVQALMSEFGATIVEQSVKPVD